MDERVELGRIPISRGVVLVFSVQEYRGKIGLDIRHWYEEGGNWLPSTRRGGVRLYADDLGVLDEALAFYLRFAARYTKKCYRGAGKNPRSKGTHPRKKGTSPRLRVVEGGAPVERDDEKRAA